MWLGKMGRVGWRRGRRLGGGDTGERDDVIASTTNSDSEWQDTPSLAHERSRIHEYGRGSKMR